MRGNFREQADKAGSATGKGVGSDTGNATGSTTGSATGITSINATKNETGSDVYEFTEPSLGSKSPEDSQDTNTSQSASNSSSSSILASKPNSGYYSRID